MSQCQWIKLQFKKPVAKNQKQPFGGQHKAVCYGESFWLIRCISFIASEYCRIEYLTVTLTSPSYSKYTFARNSTFSSGKQHKNIASMKIGQIQKSKWTACESSLQEFIQTNWLFFSPRIIKEIKLSELCQIYSLLTCINKHINFYSIILKNKQNNPDHLSAHLSCTFSSVWWPLYVQPESCRVAAWAEGIAGGHRNQSCDCDFSLWWGDSARTLPFSFCLACFLSWAIVRDV